MSHEIFVEACPVYGGEPPELVVECSCGVTLSDEKMQLSLDEIIDLAWKHRDE